MILLDDGIVLGSQSRVRNWFEYKGNDLNMEWHGRQVENQFNVLSCN